MISSKALIDQTGISRATLNNYIQLGILPKPVVQSLSADAGEGGARVLGFFPEDSLERVQSVQILKSQGLSMAEIAERLSNTEALLDTPEMAVSQKIPAKANFDEKRNLGMAKRVAASMPDSPSNKSENSLNLSLDSLAYPAYMLNYNLELTWLNEFARKDLFGFVAPPVRSVDRNLLQLLSRPESRLSLADQKGLAGLLLRVASARISYESLSKIVAGADPELTPLLDEIIFSEKDAQTPVSEYDFFQKNAKGLTTCSRVYAMYFREGILVVHAPSTELGDDLAQFLSRRDQVIQSLLGKRLPVMTPLAVIVADLQNSVKICAELPPDEYFALINEIWSTMSPILRKYVGTHGKHVGDGMVYYFFPQAESNYLFNAIACADELRIAMRKISADWQLRKNWFTELQLNIGLHEGQEWLGAFHASHHIEFAVLGNTINEASRLSDFARHGSIWATKNLVSKLSSDERSRVDFGILRKSEENGDRFVGSSYAQISSLVDLEKDKYEKMRDIGQLTVTEIRRVNSVRLY
jgi:class 3 adenylate cyclase/DNA-binding transcriptional MerR regulator